MLDGETLCRTAADIPDAARGLVQPQIETLLGETVATLFPQFATAFPKSTQTIDANFANLVLIYRFSEDRDRWYQRSLVEGKSKNIVFDIHGRHTPPDRKNFDEYLSMLPRQWRELYRCFGGFGLQSPKSLDRFAHLFPTPVHGRMDIDQFLAIKEIYFFDSSAIDNELAAGFIEKIAKKHCFPNGRAGEVRCWCLCRNGDSLWISDHDRGQNVYLIPQFDFAQPSVLDHPVEFLDQYMATELNTVGDDGARAG